MLASIPSDYILAVFIGVSLLKLPFDYIPNAVFSNWLVRLFAIVLGVAIVEAQYYGGVDHPVNMTAYALGVIGLKAGVGAILAYHIGTGMFVGFFDSGSNTTAVKNVVPNSSGGKTTIIDVTPKSKDATTTIPVTGSSTQSAGTDVQWPDTTASEPSTRAVEPTVNGTAEPDNTIVGSTS